MKLREFFEHLYPNFNSSKTKIEIRAFNILSSKTSPDIKRYFLSSIDEIVQTVQELNSHMSYNIYFECPELKPNAINGQEPNCFRYPFLYADIDDCDKDSEGNIIRTYTKEELMSRIKSFVLPPSLIIDSGHGYHLYWLLDIPIYDKAAMQYILNKIQELLGSDRNTTKLTQILRPVGTFNLKDLQAGGSPLPVQFVDGTLERYTLKEVYQTLGINIKDIYGRSTSETGKGTTAATGPTSATIVFDFKNPPPPLNVEVDNFPDLLNLLKKQNILLASNMPNYKLGKNFVCVFHKDSNPSANIFANKDGHYYYKCFGCGKLADIITICQETMKKTFAEAIIFLCEFFGIRFEYQNWITEQLYKYYQNAQVIDGFEEYKYHEMYPHLYKLLKPRLKYLAELNHYGLAKISSDRFSYKGENLFFFSYKYFSKKYRHNQTTCRNAINLFATLGLIEKVDIKELPAPIAKKAIEEARKQKSPGDPLNKRTINFYIFPNLRDRLREADEVAKALLENNFTIRNCMNKNYLLINFGKEKADNVYNDDRDISKRSLSIAVSLETTLKKLINEQGYATKQQIISKTKTAGRLKATRADKERELERFLSQFLKNNNLEYTTANKELKEMFNLRSSIKIIIPIGLKHNE